MIIYLINNLSIIVIKLINNFKNDKIEIIINDKWK